MADLYDAGIESTLPEYDTATAKLEVMGKLNRRMTVREQLEMRRALHVREIENIDAALKALDANQNVEQLLETLDKAGVRR